MAEHKQFYQRAFYYDIALNRDISDEVDFVFDVYRHYHKAELTSLLEIACGPGYHARSIAKRDVKVVGLDLMTEMLDLAREKSTAQQVEVDWMAGDMRSFQLDAPVDMAICMFDAIDTLLENDDIIQHFRTVAANLNPGGLYVVDLTHPRDCSLTNYGPFSYSGERDGVKVEIVWVTNGSPFNLLNEVAEIEIEIRIKENGTEKIIHGSVKERLLSPQQIRLLAELSGVFDIIGWYGDFDLEQPLDNTLASRRMIAVLQRVD